MATEDEYISPVDAIPGYETDLSAVGRRRTAVDPDGDKHWTEVHGLDDEQAKALIDGVA